MTDPRTSEPVGAFEIAGRLGVRRETVATWKQRNLLPPARWTVSGQDAWDWTLDIEPWARETGRMPTMNMPEQAPDPSEQPGWDVRDDITAFYRALSPEQVMDGIAKAVKAHDFEAVNVLLRVLAVKDPHQAEVVYESMLAMLAPEG